jgi:hypothetical protein
LLGWFSCTTLSPALSLGGRGRKRRRWAVPTLRDGKGDGADGGTGDMMGR